MGESETFENPFILCRGVIKGDYWEYVPSLPP